MSSRCSLGVLFCLQLSGHCLVTDAGLCGCVVWHCPFCLQNPEMVLVASTVVYEQCSGPAAVLYFLPHISQGVLENSGKAQAYLRLEMCSVSWPCQRSAPEEVSTTASKRINGKCFRENMAKKRKTITNKADQKIGNSNESSLSLSCYSPFQIPRLIQ